jgi:WD40 repeat protein
MSRTRQLLIVLVVMAAMLAADSDAESQVLPGNAEPSSPGILHLVAESGELSFQRFGKEFVDASIRLDLFEMARLVRENPRIAAEFQRKLENEPQRFGGTSLDTLKYFAGLVAELREGKSFRSQLVVLPRENWEFYSALMKASNQDLNKKTRLIQDNVKTARRVYRFLIDHAHLTDKGQGLRSALAALIGEVLLWSTLPTEPLLRIETGMHTAMIRNVRVNAAARTLVTASEDGTVRLWSLPDGRPLRVIRVPFGNFMEGTLFAMSMSPDGSIIAAGGFTGIGDGTPCIYLLDPKNGRMTRKLDGLPGAINFLAFSRDGRFLAATLDSKFGVRVWRTSDWKQVMKDTDYSDGGYGGDFDSTGRLVITSLDGFLRLYDRNFRLVKKIKAPGGKSPFAAAFSPDDKHIAIGYGEVSRVDVISSQDLGLLYSPNISGVVGESLEVVAWSADGKFLYAGGSYSHEGSTRVIRRWSGGGRGPYIELRAGRGTIMDLQPFGEGGVVYGTGGGAFGVIDANSQIVGKRNPPTVDFQGDRENFRVSHDGTRVRFGYENLIGRSALFSILERELSLDPLPDSSLSVPITRADGTDVTDWEGRVTPKLNGKPLHVSQGEVSYSLAIAPDANTFLLGTSRAINSFDRTGEFKWGVLSAHSVWRVNVSGDGRLAIGAFGNGIIRWYRISDGVEVLAFFPHRNGKEWVAWTPDGYYMSSPGGDDLIGWHINNGKAAVADFYSARQFERIFHRPDYVIASFKHLGDREKARAEVGGDFFDIEKLASIAPPKIEITSPANGATVSDNRVKLRFAVEKRSLPMRDFSVFVNGIPVTPSAKRTLGGSESVSFLREVEVPLFADINYIRVEAFNGTSMGVAESFVRRAGDISTAEKGDLYLLTVGASLFPSVPGADLDYAALDAEAVAEFFKAREGGAFKRVFVKAVSDNSLLKPTKGTILSALEFVRTARARDTVIMFLASHGLSDSQGSYYFVPRDAADQDVRSVLLSARGGRALTQGKGDALSLISWEAFFEALRSTAGRRLLVVDTCQAKNVAGTLDVHSLAKRSASASFALLAASKGDEESQEYPLGKHGLFTYAQLEGLSGKGDSDGNGRITLKEAFEYTAKFVKGNRLDPTRPQTPQLMAPGMLNDLVLAGN